MPWTRIFDGRPDQVAEVRHWLADLFPACDELDVLTTLASEVATNAVTHTRSRLPGGWFRVSVMYSGTFVRITVEDNGSPSVPAVRRDWDPFLALGGRGLRLVEQMSAAWGTGGDPRGRLVWFDAGWPGGVLPLPDGDPAALEWLRGRHPRVHIWVGQQTRTWLAVPPSGAGSGVLIEAPTAGELDRQLAACIPAAAPVPGQAGGPLRTAAGRPAPARGRPAALCPAPGPVTARSGGAI